MAPRNNNITVKEVKTTMTEDMIKKGQKVYAVYRKDDTIIEGTVKEILKMHKSDFYNNNIIANPTSEKSDNDWQTAVTIAVRVTSVYTYPSKYLACDIFPTRQEAERSIAVYHKAIQKYYCDQITDVKSLMQFCIEYIRTKGDNDIYEAIKAKASEFDLNSD